MQRGPLEESLASALSQRVADDSLSVEVQGSAHDPRTAVIRVLHAKEVVAARSFSPGPPRCADFHEAVALAIAMMLRTLESPLPDAAPGAASSREPADSARRPERAADTRALPARVELEAPRLPTVVYDQPASPAPAPTRTPWGLSLRAAGLLSSHVAASSAAGARLELALERGSTSLRAGMLALYSSTQRIADSQVRYLTRPLAGSLGACASLLDSASWALHACAGLLAGRVRLHARRAPGVTPLSASTQPWFALTAQLELARRLGSSSWLLLSLAPAYAPRKLGAETQASSAAPAMQSVLPRLGAIFALGVAYDVRRQGSGRHRHR
ncbi:MAG: hypothetical protein JWN48_1239 [Myxococcaceae bacterium]|nr:hypothetical protein [Myxococcaceae bacterium]